MTDARIARVVVACDAVGENHSSIETAARLAAWLDASLHGVFVEDEALLHLAALPSVRHVGANGESFSAIDERTVLHHFEARASRMRAALETAARARTLGWSFDVVRRPADAAFLATDQQTLLVIEAESRPFAGSTRMASRLLTAALKSEMPILLLRSGPDARHDIVALVQQTAAAARVVVLAARLASAGKRPLTLFLTGSAEPSVIDLVRSISPALADHCQVERPSRNTLASAACSGRLLVVDGDPAINDRTSVENLLATTQADILFLR